MGAGQRVVAERPYYCKVDSDGRQLPFLDRVVYDVVSEKQAIILKLSSGEFDMHARHVTQPQNKPVFAQQPEDG